jgi:multidrug efflux pump subunit AcrB
MERKPQQQTLSIRVSDSLREFLERSKQVISAGRGESVSLSDVAKVLLESAREDRLDFRLEVADLQKSPTESLCAIRQKGK